MAVIYLNGNFIDETDAKISVFDRGFLFADSIYEVTALINNHFVDFDFHVERLERSCREMGFKNPFSSQQLLDMHHTLAAHNNLSEGIIYLQISRGVLERNFLFPAEMKPTIFAFSKQLNITAHLPAVKGIKVMTLPDDRWRRRDIKTTQLTAQSLAKTHAVQLGHDDAWMTQDGYITEGTSNNAFIITPDNVIITRDISSDILSGVTRKSILDIASSIGFSIEERAFSIDEAIKAKEAFSTSTSTLILPVIAIDGHMIGSGYPGPITKKLRKAYISRLTNL